MREALREFGPRIVLSRQEIEGLVKHWDEDDSGKVDYREFVKGLRYSYTPLKSQSIPKHNDVIIFDSKLKIEASPRRADQGTISPRKPVKIFSEPMRSRTLSR